MTFKSLPAKPSRVISLVPSYTESLFDLGFGNCVVGITDYCIHPAEKLKNISSIGGPKNPRISDILALKPDLVLANQEENYQRDIEILEKAGINTWAAFPRTVRESLADLWTLEKIFHSNRAVDQIRFLERSLEMVERAQDSAREFTYFCPVWQETDKNNALNWITISDDTYTSDLLRIFGGVNCISSGTVERYPKITSGRVIELNPDVIFLPSEPYCFTENDATQFMNLFSETKAGRSGRICCLDGTLITWVGTRLGKALSEIPSIIDNLIL